VLFFSACGEGQQAGRDFSEVSIAELHDGMQRGELTSEQLVSWYLQRIDAIDRNGPALNSMIEVNPEALQIARALDEEWQASGPRGPMHGIPVVLKANIDTADLMKTSAGSLALKDHIPPADAFLVARLREAGAVILGKSNLSEWANYRGDDSSSGWSSLGGQTYNPYGEYRNPCGSSSGSGVSVSANLTAVAVGTETDGSVVCPSGVNGIVGIKPTIGLVSRSGIIPIAHSQDTAGPMARSVRDAAILLAAMTGADPEDPDSVAAEPAKPDYTATLTADALQGKRIGVIRNYYGSDKPKVKKVFDTAIEALRAAGAEIVDGIEFEFEDAWTAESEVLAYEFKTDLKKYFERSVAPYSTLAEIIEFNENNADAVMPHFGQERMLNAEEKGPLTDEAYLEALATAKKVSQESIDGALAEHKLDALIAPTNGPSWMTDHANGDSFHVSSSSYAAISGYPSITVPAGAIAGLPIGMSFIGTAFKEQELIEMAYAFEQATHARLPPDLKMD
jgi:amidase